MSYTITDKCIGCTLCAKRCPMKAISGAPKTKHEIDPNVCVDCGLCGKLCAKEAILDEAGTPARKIPKDLWKKPVVKTYDCVGCSVCIENCPANVLSLTEPKRRGDTDTVAFLSAPDKCIGCGICEKVCPIGAISVN